MTDLEDRILTHIGLYQLSFAKVIEHCFFDGQPCGHDMNQLHEQRRVQIRRGYEGGPKYYQLTRAELLRRGLPEWRSKRPKSQAFPTAVSILCFCNLAAAQRHLLEPNDIVNLFPSGLPEGAHCVERNDDGYRIFRIRVTNLTADPDQSTLARSLRNRVSQAMTFPGLRPWVTTGRYAFAILTESIEHTETIRKLIAGDELLSSFPSILVEQTPSLRNR